VDGEKVRQLRRQKHLTQEGLAEKADASLKAIRNIETKPDYRPNPHTIRQLATALAVPAEELLCVNHEPPLLVTSSEELLEWNVRIVNEAQERLCTIGSRSRDKRYLEAILRKLREAPALKYYRVLFGPPLHDVFRDHLLRLLEVRDPADRSQGGKTIHIGLFEDIAKQAEVSMCANESTALIVMPSFRQLGQYDCAIVIRDPDVVAGLGRFVHTLYHAAKPVERRNELENLPRVAQHHLSD
jgi:transcriptional regulator with XRE-family HTH domain